MSVIVPYSGEEAQNTKTVYVYVYLPILSVVCGHT